MDFGTVGFRVLRATSPNERGKRTAIYRDIEINPGDPVPAKAL